MSSVVRTRTPFLNEPLLMQALETIGCSYTVDGNNIITNRIDYRGNQRFVFHDGKYLFQHEDGDFGLQQYGSEKHKPTHSFLADVEKAYNAIYKRQLEELERKRMAAIAEAERLHKERMAEQERLRLLAKAEEERKKAEEEKQRLERERKEYVEKQKAAIIAKAKEQGYDIQETVVGSKIKLVLVQTTY
jgi:hypothetical protein